MQLCLTPKPVLHDFPNLRFWLVTCWNIIYLALHYPEQGAVLPVRFRIIRIIVCTQQDVQGQSLSCPGSREGSTAAGTLLGRGFSWVLALISPWTRSCFAVFKAVLRHVQYTQCWHEQWHQWQVWQCLSQQGFGLWFMPCSQPRKADRAVDCVLSCNLSSCSPSIAIGTE